MSDRFDEFAADLFPLDIRLRIFRVRLCSGRESRRPILLLYGPERSGNQRFPEGAAFGSPCKSSEASMLHGSLAASFFR